PDARRDLDSSPTRRSSDLVERQLSEPIPARVRFTIPVLDRADPAAELIAVRLVDREHCGWHAVDLVLHALQRDRLVAVVVFLLEDRKSTRLNSSHVKISYA